jgi:hypothetical protein
MITVGFNDFTRLNESQTGHYSIEFSSPEDFKREINSEFEKKLESILDQNVSPFLYEIKKVSPREISIEIRINPNDFLSEIVKRDTLELRVALPTELVSARDKINPNSIFDSIQRLKYLGDGSLRGIKVFADERNGSIIEKMSITADPKFLDKIKRDAAFFLGRTDNSLTRQDLEEFDSAKIYEAFMKDNSSLEVANTLGNTISSLARYKTLLDFFENSIVTSTKKEFPQKDFEDALITASSSSPSKEEMLGLKTTFRSLLLLSEEGRPESEEYAYRLSKLLGTLIETYGSEKEIKRALAVSK